jgi:hypothetical protein
VQQPHQQDERWIVYAAGEDHCGCVTTSDVNISLINMITGGVAFISHNDQPYSIIVSMYLCIYGIC